MTAEKTYLAIDLDPTKAELSSSPLHITLTPPVSLAGEKVDEVVATLRATFRDISPFTVVGGGTSQFGPHEDPVAVREIILTDEVRRVHTLAMGVLRHAAPDIDLTYTGDNYHPHSTFKDGKGLGEDEQRAVDHLTLLRKVGAEWTRIAQIYLVGTDETTS